MSTEDFNDFMITSNLAIAGVMTQVNTVESMINAYIAEFYTRCPAGDYQQPYIVFIADIMDNKFISLSAKIDILFRTFNHISKEKAKGRRASFNKWLEIRNKLAHGNIIGGKNKILYGGEFYDAKALREDFSKSQLKIMATLEVFSELRGPYFNHYPVKDERK
jgi:hypothetical protein